MGACAGYVKGGAASASETCKDAAVASTAYHRSPSAQATPTTPRRPRRPRRRRRRPKPRRRPRRSSCRRPVNWHLGCRRPTPPDPSRPAASKLLRGSGNNSSNGRRPPSPCRRGPSHHQKHRRRRGLLLMVNLHQNCPRVEERRSRATILGRSRYSRATGAARCVEDRTLGEEMLVHPEDVEDVDQRATPERTPTKGH